MKVLAWNILADEFVEEYKDIPEMLNRQQRKKKILKILNDTNADIMWFRSFTCYWFHRIKNLKISIDIDRLCRILRFMFSALWVEDIILVKAIM